MESVDPRLNKELDDLGLSRVDTINSDNICFFNSHLNKPKTRKSALSAALAVQSEHILSQLI